MIYKYMKAVLHVYIMCIIHIEYTKAFDSSNEMNITSFNLLFKSLKNIISISGPTSKCVMVSN